MLHQDRAGFSLELASGPRSCMPASGSRCYAEAGASPSSEALSEELPEAKAPRPQGNGEGVEGGSAPSEGSQGLSGGAIGNWTVQRVLVSRVGCRSW
jgi:hypothetical protein